MTDSDPLPSRRDSPGLFDSLRRALATLIELVYTRLELVGVEVEATVRHFLGLLLWCIVALFSASLAMLMLVLTVLIALWDTHRLLAAGVITASLALVALAAVFVVRHRVRTRPRLLAATIAELRRDITALDGRER